MKWRGRQQARRARGISVPLISRNTCSAGVCTLPRDDAGGLPGVFGPFPSATLDESERDLFGCWQDCNEPMSRLSRTMSINTLNLLNIDARSMKLLHRTRSVEKARGERVPLITRHGSRARNATLRRRWPLHSAPTESQARRAYG